VRELQTVKKQSDFLTHPVYYSFRAADVKIPSAEEIREE